MKIWLLCHHGMAEDRWRWYAVIYETSERGAWSLSSLCQPLICLLRSAYVSYKCWTKQNYLAEPCSASCTSNGQAHRQITRFSFLQNRPQSAGLSGSSLSLEKWKGQRPPQEIQKLWNLSFAAHCPWATLCSYGEWKKYVQVLLFVFMTAECFNWYDSA